MVYLNGLIVVVKSDNQILRERNENGEQIVLLPFGSDYSLLIKNKQSKKAEVKVEIDGKDVLDGNALLINPNTESELAGFIKEHTVNNKFRFIQKTEKVAQYRGDRIDDGIIRVEYRFEKPITTHTTVIHQYEYRPRPSYGPSMPYPPPMFTGITYKGDTADDGITSDASEVTKRSFTGAVNASAASFNMAPQEGITVPGQHTQQRFNYGNIGPLEEESYVIVIRLQGITSSNVTITKPLVVNDKLTCSSCGTKWTTAHKYCGECGTALI